jgi:hypothetical protein
LFTLLFAIPSQVNIAFDVAIIATNLNLLRDQSTKQVVQHAFALFCFIFICPAARWRREHASSRMVLDDHEVCNHCSTLEFTRMTCLACHKQHHQIHSFTFLCSTTHLSAFLLPMALYNGRIQRLQVFEPLEQHPISVAAAHFFITCLQFHLNSYCARLNGLAPPLVDFSGWSRPLGKNFLISIHSKVRVAAAIRKENYAFCFLIFIFNLAHQPLCEVASVSAHAHSYENSSPYRPQVNTMFDTEQAAVAHRCRNLVSDLSCIFFQVCGAFTVTLRVVSAVVASIITLSTWLNW